MKFVLGMLAGTLLTLCLMPQYAATLPLQTINYSRFAPEDLEEPSAVEGLGSNTALCLRDKAALKKLGSRKWEPVGVNRFGDMTITSLKDDDDPTGSFCVVMPIAFGLPGQTQVRDGILAPAD
jgi:hypothetical protein